MCTVLYDRLLLCPICEEEMCVDVEKKNNFPQQGFFHFLPSRSIFAKTFLIFQYIYFRMCVCAWARFSYGIFIKFFLVFMCSGDMRWKSTWLIFQVYTIPYIELPYSHSTSYTSIWIHGYETYTLHIRQAKRRPYVSLIVIEYICF